MSTHAIFLRGADVRGGKCPAPVILDAYTDSNSADRIYWSYSEEPSHRDVPLFSNSIVLLVQLVVL